MFFCHPVSNMSVPYFSEPSVIVSKYGLVSENESPQGNTVMTRGIGCSYFSYNGRLQIVLSAQDAQRVGSWFDLSILSRQSDTGTVTWTVPAGDFDPRVNPLKRDGLIDFNRLIASDLTTTIVDGFNGIVSDVRYSDLSHSGCKVLSLRCATKYLAIRARTCQDHRLVTVLWPHFKGFLRMHLIHREKTACRLFLIEAFNAYVPDVYPQVPCPVKSLHEIPSFVRTFSPYSKLIYDGKFHKVISSYNSFVCDYLNSVEALTSNEFLEPDQVLVVSASYPTTDDRDNLMSFSERCYLSIQSSFQRLGCFIVDIGGRWNRVPLMYYDSEGDDVSAGPHSAGHNTDTLVSKILVLVGSSIANLARSRMWG